ncbi:hypothetical protein GGS20DRAFT_11650 [Poronia punctata]|nr:hypothetical protein GGS20DRAFT_11650 [Poronia punctata]
MESLETQVLENGRWVTRTITAHELTARRHARQSAHTPLGETPKAPVHGLLTKTLIESPIIRWVLPAQVRSARFNDVAFVGDNSVEIRELGTDMELRPPVGQKLHFDVRIRSCCVLGTHDYLRYLHKASEDRYADYYQDSDTDMDASDLFQQLLILLLDTGEIGFLFMSLTPADEWELVYSGCSQGNDKLSSPGSQLAISPDGGYLALSSMCGLFSIYELETIEELRSRHRHGLELNPLRSRFVRPANGIIHKIDFLYPGSEHASHVILMLIVINSGVSRLVIYDWEKSESWARALYAEKRGHRLDDAAGLPLLVIPLTVGCQFLLVSEHLTATCTDVLSGPPTLLPFNLAYKEPSPSYYGTGAPMWTAWTRPMREASYFANADLIWLAREDGQVTCLEIKGDHGVDSNIYLGPLHNIDSTFAILSIPGGEVLISGGDHGPGAIWAIRPRERFELIGSTLNWAPTLDMSLTDEGSRKGESPFAKETSDHLSTRGRLFTCSGRGVDGAIVELRYGMRANIGLDLSYSSPIRRCWAIPNFDDIPDAGFHMLLALPESSALLQVSHDYKEVSEKGQDETNFDLLSATLAVYASQDLVVQITTAHVTIVAPQNCYQHSISDMTGDPLATVTHAAVTKERLAISSYSDSVFKIRLFTFDSTRLVLRQVLQVEGQVTALSVGALSGSSFALAGLWQEDQSSLAMFPLEFPEDGERMSIDTDLQPATLKIELDQSTTASAITSIICLDVGKILVGLRNGYVLTVQPSKDGQFESGSTVIRTTYFGLSPSYLFEGIPLDEADSAVVCNDAGLALIMEPRHKSGPGSFEKILRVWPTDASDTSMPSPTVNSVTGLQAIRGYGDKVLIMISGPRILVTELTGTGPVPWYIRVGGSPKGILYSERLDTLVTTVVKDGCASLHFLDPETGADLSRPARREKGGGSEKHIDVDYISGMGSPDTKIHALMPWRYLHKGKMWEWFLVLTTLLDGTGRILVVSAEQEATKTDPTDDSVPLKRRIRFWIQFQVSSKEREAVRVAATTTQGVFFGSESTVEHYCLDNKKLKLVMTYHLPSPPTRLEVVDGYLHVLTARHSLVVLDYTSAEAVEKGCMQPVHADDTARAGLHSITLQSSSSELEDQGRLNLVSNPMCGLYGLWSPHPKFGVSALRLTAQAELAASVRRFCRGRTRPYWARDKPRYGKFDAGRGKEDIIGLSLDGSLRQFCILDEKIWRLFKYIQNLATTAEAPRDMVLHRPSPTPKMRDPFLLDDPAGPKEMHINGDILQRCLEKRTMEHLVSKAEEFTRLRELLFEAGSNPGEEEEEEEETWDDDDDDETRVFEYVYGILEYYLAPAL